MEGATYAQNRFSDVVSSLEKAENKPAEDTTTTVVDTAVVDDTATTVADTTQVPETGTEAAPQEVVEENVSSFDLGGGETAEQAAVSESTVATPSFNLDEELKKIDRKEILKKVGVTDFAIEIDEYLSKGGNAVDYLNAKAIDYNKIADEDLIKQDLQRQYPTFTPQQINLMYNRKYTVDPDALDDDKEFVSLQLKADAHNVRQQKIAEQQKFKIPETPILQKDEAYEQWKEQQQSQPRLMEEFRSFYENHEATKALNESKRVTISLGEGVPPFNFKIDQPQMLTKAMTDGGATLNKLLTTQSGEPNVAKQQLVTLFSFNPEKFIQDIFKYGQSMGVRKELVEEGQNAQRPQAKVTDMNTSTKPVITGTGTFGAKSRQ